MTVAVLYVDPRGVYASMPGIDAWDEYRDARNYRGPGPVVAHPPCAPYSRLRHLWQRDGEEYTALRAVEQVREFGGCLEHPEGSKLWDVAGLPAVDGLPDEFGGYTIEVEQVEWGHVARKRTWVYLVGVPRSAIGRPPFPGREPTHWCSGGRTRSSRKGSPVPPGIKVCSAQQRRRTPPLFAEWLVSLAKSARKERAA